jgi:glycosyltransferase involved in cell wall biosynthesis
MELRIVALLAARNEALYLERCLAHLHAQGIQTCVIDNGSTDATEAIARSFVGRGVFRIDRLPYKGFFDLVEQLRYKERLTTEIEADWFIHMDADEIREAPAPGRTLHAAISAVDAQGYNAINFDEFVFLPTNDSDSFEGTDYVERMRYYYFFEPEALRRINAWKKTSQPVELTMSGGHMVQFEGRRIFPDNFVLRHYIVLSRRHAIAKYGSDRVYSIAEIEERQWHGSRARFDPGKLKLPDRHSLKNIESGRWDRSDPWRRHRFLEAT